MKDSASLRQGLDALKAGRYADARKLFDEHEAEAGTAKETRALLAQAEANLAAGRVDDAAEQLVAAVERNPGLAEAYVSLSRIALFTGQNADARTHATAAVKLGPQLPLAWTLLGLVHEAEGDAAGAERHLEKGAQLGAHEALAHYNLGRFLTSAGRAAEGIPALLKATELAPKNADAFIALGLAQRALKQYEKALASLEKAKELQPKNPDTWATLADVLFEVKEFKAARDMLDHGLAAVGDHPALLEKAIASAMLQDDVPGAVAYLEREVKVVPQHAQAWLNLAYLSLRTGDFDRSEAAAKALLEREPKHWEAWFHLGNLYDAVPDAAKAEAAYRQAVAAAPDNWKVLMNFATCLLQEPARAKHEEAKALLTRAKAHAPQGEWRVHYNLALASVRLGDDAAALALAQEIQRGAGPEEPMRAEAQKLEANLREKAS